MKNDIIKPMKIDAVIENLKRNGMEGYFAESGEELPALMEKLIPAGSTVGCGDSVTLEQLGVFEFLRNQPVSFLDKHAPNLTAEEKRDIYVKNFDVDTFVTGTNAVTVEGDLFNIDGNGSRVAPMLYGPKQVVVVVGINKIVDSVEAAIERARQIAAPLDAERLGKNTPCAKLGRCVNCRHEQRICNSFVLISGQFMKSRIKVIFVNQSLGY